MPIDSRTASSGVVARPLVQAPRRIQRKRTKGWRMPEGAVYVGRPTPWGNPFTVADSWVMWVGVAMGFNGDMAGRRRAAVALYRAWLTGTLPPIVDPTPGGEVSFDNGREVSAHGMVMGFAGAAAAVTPPPTIPARPDLSVLRGKALACFCPLDQPCHADVLLELANQ